MADIGGSFGRMQRFFPLRFQQVEPSHVLDLDSSVGLPLGYFPTNPSFVDVPQGRLVSIRGVNYIGGAKGALPTFTIGEDYHSLTRFVLETAGSAPRALSQLDDALEGAEDVRLFEHDGKPWCVYSQPGGDGGCKMTIAEIDIDAQTVKSTPLASPYGFSQEKNWSPFSFQGDIYFVYSFAPLIVLKFDPGVQGSVFANREFAEVDPIELGFLNGGSGAGISLSSGFLFSVHRRLVRFPTMERIYVHRFALLSPSMDRVRWGRYFVIGRPEVQFVAAISTTSEGGCEMSYGRSDRHACLAVFSANSIARLLPAGTAGNL